ncbi:MAG: spinster family MFS transporter [Allosphingosinicella sp.]|uniref:spinster family MFS transporter n=1 Tax=Allosphingosinicella sp. TaxID=2823234 RepID=UPI0039614935
MATATDARSAPIVGTPPRVVLWILLLVYILNFLDRQIVNILAEPIKQELGLSDTQIGLMTGLAFALFYTFLGIPIARYADNPKTSRVGLISVSLAFWSAMTAVCGLAQNFVQLLLARVGVGVGEAGCTPAAHSLISDTVPPAKRSSAIAFYGLGIPIGGLVGMVMGGLLADAYGWRVAFFVAGAPGVLLALALPFILKEPRRIAGPITGASPAAPDRMGLKAALAEIGRSKALVNLIIAASLVAFLAYGKTVWTTIFFIRTHGLSPGQTGLWLGIGVGVATMLGTWAGGQLADRFGGRDPRHIVTAPAIGMLVAAPILFVGYWSQDWLLGLVLIVVAAVLNNFYYGPTFACVQGLVAPQARAMATAVMLFAQNLIGLGLGPLFFGMLSDGVRPMAGEESVRWVLFGAAWLGLIPAWFFWRARVHLAREMKARP